MFYLFCMSLILGCILFVILSALLSLLLKMLKLENKEFVKSRPLLYKLTISYGKIKDIKIIIFLLYAIFILIGLLIICYFMWDSYWLYK